ncbi:hypothetical protein HELRODRAFT_175651 [Helobdella robusta]|uniref:Ig-like domain-containing protein n=1 Tax=Helobdella robusta TaxID=6412 RepID=T1F9H1_HELRO|nr:hypothetical protein HELRODRAFT_175651 [Helobdella robusta]ESO00669.1 hypothetical protein HELRODRAFT_175651 [Helobdella robusta]
MRIKISMTCWLFLMLSNAMLSREVQGMTDLLGVEENEQFWRRKIFYNQPSFKMLKRQLIYSSANSKDGGGLIQSIHMVFSSDKQIDVRWFRSESTNSDPNFKLNLLRSGEVWAAKLDFVGLSLLKDFVTIFSSKDGSIHYQLNTKIDTKSISGSTNHVSLIQSPDWLISPPNEVTFEIGQNGGFADELELLKSKKLQQAAESQQQHRRIQHNSNSGLSRKQHSKKSSLKWDFQSIINYHRDTTARTESTDEGILVGKKYKMPGDTNNTIYYVGMHVFNASQSESGKYLCRFERRHDTLVHLSRVTGLSANEISSRRSKPNYFTASNFKSEVDDVSNENAGDHGEVSRRKSTKKNKKTKIINRDKRQALKLIQSLQDFGPNTEKERDYKRDTANRNSSSSSNFNNDIHIELISCDDGLITDGVVRLFRNRPTCLRCRAVDSSGKKFPSVSIFKNDVDLADIFSAQISSNKMNLIRKKKRSVDGGAIAATATAADDNYDDDYDDDIDEDDYNSDDDNGENVDNSNYDVVSRDNNDEDGDGDFKRVNGEQISKKRSKRANDIMLKINKYYSKNKGDDNYDDEEDSNIPKVDRLSYCSYHHNHNSHNQPQQKHFNNKCVGVSKFINVLDGGVSEMTLTFHRPSTHTLTPGHGYSCKASSGSLSARIDFRIEISK